MREFRALAVSVVLCRTALYNTGGDGVRGKNTLAVGFCPCENWFRGRIHGNSTALLSSVFHPWEIQLWAILRESNHSADGQAQAGTERLEQAWLVYPFTRTF